jgi:glycerol-3-phosphate acyltransferase PlsY
LDGVPLVTNLWATVFSIALAYLIGSIPVGAIIVRLTSGKNVLNEHSGRTGGTNVMRTAGFWAGLATALGDLLKGFLAVSVSLTLTPTTAWVHAAAGAMAVLGHNQSIFLLQRGPDGLRLRGGAGGATAVGAGVALWPGVAAVVVVVPFLLFGLGYASVTTLTVGVLMTLGMALEARAGNLPWPYAAYGLAALSLMSYALRPNLSRLRRGQERRVRWPAGKPSTTEPGAGRP